MERGLSKQEIIQHLVRSEHGNLESYWPIVVRASVDEPEFLAHMIAWNQRVGQIRDTKVALPTLSLKCPHFLERELVENSLAHVLVQSPRDIVRALRLTKDGHGFSAVVPRPNLSFTGVIVKYLRALEAKPMKWERIALQHRRSIKELYALTHTRPVHFAEEILFKGNYANASLFLARSRLKDMTALEAAGTILEKKIPFVTITGLQPHWGDKTFAMALIERMSATELVTNTRMLERLGVKTDPALRSAFEAGLKRVADGSAKASQRATMKAERAAEAIGDEKLAGQLRAAGERAIDRISVEGDWVILADRSPSMDAAVEKARMLADALARMARGKVHLIFFDGSLHKYVNATGMTYEQVKEATRGMKAGGSGTSIGVGLAYLREKGLRVDGIAIVSDGGENAAPMFPLEYPKYCAFVGKDVPVYLYWLKGTSEDGLSINMRRAQLEMQKFDANGVDMYSLPNLVQTMRTSRYGLIEQIMDAKLLTLADVLK